MVGDGEAETGPLATSWHSNKFLNPARDGAVLPILHLNGYKIASPTVLARMPHGELDALLRGYGWAPRFVEGSSPAVLHEIMARTVDEVIAEIQAIQTARRPVRPDLADDRAAHAQGLDGSQGDRRRPHRGHVPRPPGAHRGHGPPRAPGRAGDLDAQLPPGGAVRRTGACAPSWRHWRPRARAA